MNSLVFHPDRDFKSARQTLQPDGSSVFDSFAFHIDRTRIEILKIKTGDSFADIVMPMVQITLSEF